MSNDTDKLIDDVLESYGKYQLTARIDEDNIVNKDITFGLCHSVIMFVTFNEVEQQAKRHQPHLVLRQIEVCDAVVQKPGE